MSKRLPFRDMRQTQTAAKAEAGLLLGLPGIDWDKQYYAFFFVMGESEVKNPTYKQSFMLTVMWLRFLRQLINQLSETSTLRSRCQSEFDKLSYPYKQFLEEPKV